MQNVACSTPIEASYGTGVSAYNYTVTVETRFSNHTASFIHTGTAASHGVDEPKAYNLVIRTPASIHNHLPVPISFDLGVS